MITRTKVLDFHQFTCIIIFIFCLLVLCVYFLEEIAAKYESAEKITLVMDNLNTHSLGSFYEPFQPDKAKSLRDRFQFVYTPKHGSWLNMAEIRIARAYRAVPESKNR